MRNKSVAKQKRPIPNPVDHFKRVRFQLASLMMSNILEAAQAPGPRMVEAFNRKTSQLTIRVSHDNASLDPEQLSRMLGAASRRTKDDSESDLCLVRDVVCLHGGHFTVENGLGECLSFRRSASRHSNG